jgi:hypothetical protein
MLLGMTRAATRTVRAAVPALVLALAGALLSGCGGSPVAVGPAGTDELTIPTPSPDPADFAGGAENVFFPLENGDRWTYRQYTLTGHRSVVATVLPAPRAIAGVATTAVRWQVRDASGRHTVLVRWYAEDRAGNVWWFGQRVRAPGPVLDRLAPRSWVAGRRGAEAGLILTATPRLGDGYANAVEPRVVARRSTVVSLDGTVATVERAYRHAVVTRDLSSLAPLNSVQTFYVRGLGMVAQQDIKATSTSLSLMRFHQG